MKKLSSKIRNLILQSQENEITEHFIYLKLAASSKNSHNRKLLGQIAQDEAKHYHFWQKYSQKEVPANQFKIWLYYLIARIFGLTFGVRLMEKGEGDAQKTYTRIAKTIPEARNIIEDETQHEQKLIDIINEEKLEYIGSMVLGLNDALVELTGALAGLTFALQNTRLIAMTGLVIGIAASFSMAASEYLSIKSEEGKQDPLKASFYTGLAYIFAVAFLVTPYLVFRGLFVALGFTLLNAILIILIFTFYVSVAKNIDFKKRFLEMSSVSLGVAVLSFGIGFVVRHFFGVEV